MMHHSYHSMFNKLQANFQSTRIFNLYKLHQWNTIGTSNWSAIFQNCFNSFLTKNKLTGIYWRIIWSTFLHHQPAKSWPIKLTKQQKENIVIDKIFAIFELYFSTPFLYQLSYGYKDNLKILSLIIYKLVGLLWIWNFDF